jgi:polyisoprenoid-binding protein YceI
MRVASALLLTLLGAAYADTPPPAGATHYVLDPAKSSLEFAFSQAGAQNKGHFKHFTVNLDVAADAPIRLDVTIDMSSLDTGDQERDDTLKSADLFAVKQFPQAHFLATQFTKSAGGFQAQGKLTIRNVTRDAQIPLSWRSASEGGASVAYLSGKTSVQRLDYGVGQGDWKATDQVGNAVAVSYTLRLSAAR